MSTQNIYCYLRVSTAQQDVKGNQDELTLKAVELGYDARNIKWLIETVSGMKHYENRLLGQTEFKKGDVLITSEVSRIGRTLTQIMTFLSKLLEIGVKVHFTKSKFEMDNSLNSQIMIFAHSIVSQLERELISTRTRDALRKKKEQGVNLGRPSQRMVLDSKIDEIKEQYEKGITLSRIGKNYNTTAITISKLLKKHNVREVQPYIYKNKKNNILNDTKIEV